MTEARFDPSRGPSRRSRVFAHVLGTLGRPTLQVVHRSDRAVRAARIATDAVFAHQPLARGIRTTRVDEGGVRGLWFEGGAAGGKVLLHLHGGGFVLCSSGTHQGLVSALCRASGASALSVDYRRAPEHPFPAAADDALAAYRLLLARGHDAGSITLVGDSAGGHLVGRLLLDIDEHGLPMPAGAVLMSPFLDLTVANARVRDRDARDPMIFPSGAEWAARAYAGDLAPDDPQLDVIGGDLRNWPPVLIQVGDRECLISDAERLAEALTFAGVPVELQVWPGQVHDFPVFLRCAPEAVAAVNQAADFVRTTVAPRPALQTA